MTAFPNILDALMPFLVDLQIKRLLSCHWFGDFENGWSFDWAINGYDLLLIQNKSV